MKKREIDREAEMNLNNAQGEITIRENYSDRRVSLLSMRGCIYLFKVVRRYT